MPSPTPAQALAAVARFRNAAGQISHEKAEAAVKAIVGLYEVVSWDNFIGGYKGRTTVECKEMVSAVLHDEGLSYPQIARACGRTNHSTFHSAAQRWKAKQEKAK